MQLENRRYCNNFRIRWSLVCFYRLGFINFVFVIGRSTGHVFATLFSRYSCVVCEVYESSWSLKSSPPQHVNFSDPASGGIIYKSLRLQRHIFWSNTRRISTNRLGQRLASHCFTSWISLWQRGHDVEVHGWHSRSISQAFYVRNLRMRRGLHYEMDLIFPWYFQLWQRSLAFSAKA